MAGRLARGFGLAAALLVPAVVFAQQLPNGFPANPLGENTVLSTATLNGMRQEILNLRGRVLALEQASPTVGLGSPLRVAALSFTDGQNTTKTATMMEDGFLLARGIGPGSFDAASVDITVGNISNVGRSRVGNSTLVPVRQGDVVSVQVSGLAGNIDVYFVSLQAQ